MFYFCWAAFSSDFTFSSAGETTTTRGDTILVGFCLAAILVSLTVVFALCLLKKVRQLGHASLLRDAFTKQFDNLNVPGDLYQHFERKNWYMLVRQFIKQIEMQNKNK